MSTDFTPGPWVWFCDPGIDVTEPHIKFLKGADGQGFAHTVGLNEPRDTNNARLIAAAPDMLIALQSIVRIAQSGDWRENAISVCRAAIEKATEL